MSYGKNELVNTAIKRAFALVDYNIYNDTHKRYEFKKQTILTDESLTENEKNEAIILITKAYDADKITFNEECQINTFKPNRIVEWVPYNNLKNIKYLAKGGFSEIYTANWIEGHFIEWDSKEQQLKRFGNQIIVLKRLENVENANHSWLEEAKSHLIISNKWPDIVQCYGLTQDPSNGDYMLVMNKLNIDLRKYLQQNHYKLTWKERISIINDVTMALSRIHDEKAIHRDLHSGNILFKTETFRISDLGFCGPVDKPLKSIYGNLPYIAPEVIIGKEQTYESDIYSIAMLMWEISSGQPPFINYEHNYDLAMNIINGIRPKIGSGTPLKYENLMKQCWDADPSNRPNIETLRNKIRELNLFYQNKSNDQTEENNNNLEINNNVNNSENSISTIFYSKSLDFHIPDNNIQDDHKRETMKLKVKKNDINFDDEDEIYNNPNLHSEEQNELELPDGNN
ncbi:kinase-like domain-containing protein [Rhizophagus clarus]|uniref:Kinase-like domain-containing protein n=1 Tax=Rhizophagus clarus TaxID=94130 RepID=A0A8H3KXH3_9GLOM|nr:kinase-like domain-containing protein [Rhizophagus clarus]